MEFEQVTTKSGDRGHTSLSNGDRVTKKSKIIVALGEIDSLNAHLGIIRSQDTIRRYDKNVIKQIQQDLYEIMAMVSKYDLEFTSEKVEFLERKQKLYMKFCKIPNVFINFGECKESALFNLARTQVRKAEIAYLSMEYNRMSVVQEYLNRLSDLIYVLSIIYENANTKKMRIKKNWFDFIRKSR